MTVAPHALVRAPDYSNWSGPVDLASVAKAGFAAVGWKASEGTGFIDRTFAPNWRRAEQVGLGRIAYHFAHASFGVSPEAEADHFLAAVRAAGGWHPWDIPALDVESGNLSGAALDAWINRWCLRVERAWRAGLIYSGAWFLVPKHVNLAGPIRRGWQLWSSAYGSHPTIFSGFTSWRLWQHSDGRFGPTPHRAGNNGPSDMNIANGDYSQWTAWTHYQVHALKPVKYASRRLDMGMRGTDVVQFQRALNNHLTRRGHKTVKADGIYGAKTENACHWAKYLLGVNAAEFKRRGASARAQIIIQHPSKRNPDDYARAFARRRRHNAK